MSNSLKKGIFYVFLANVINLIFNLITNFVLPKKLSIGSYADIKTYQLYVSYAGLFHFGFVDGMYIKYGGKNINSIDKRDLKINLNTLRLFQIIISALFLFVSIITRDIVLIFFSVSIVPLNLGNYFKQLYQATGEFSLYGKIMNITTALIFIANMIWIFIFKVDNPFYFLASNVVAYIIVWIFLEIDCKKYIGNIKSIFPTFSFKELITNIKAGILLTIGNLSSILLTSMDRWFVKALLNTVAFAEYSFAVSMENFMNTAVTPVTITLYNYFCKTIDHKKIHNVRNYIMIFSTAIVACAFPAKFILEKYLHKYTNSIDVMFLLFAAQIFYIIIKSIYVNLYKANRQQRLYFVKLASVIFVGFLFNIICFKIVGVKESFAVGTLLSAIYWYILCIVDFKWIKLNVKELLYPFFEMAIFLICGFYLKAIIGFIIYIVCTIVVAKIFMTKEIDIILKTAIRKIKLSYKKK